MTNQENTAGLLAQETPKDPFEAAHMRVGAFLADLATRREAERPTGLEQHLQESTVNNKQ